MKPLFSKLARLYIFFCFLVLTSFSFGQSPAKPCVSSITNGGFEARVVSVGTGYITTGAPNISEWNTTATDDKIEIWRSGFQGVPAYSGDHFAELNAFEVAALYTDICASCTGTIRWEFAHRGRTGRDVCELTMGPPGGPYTTLQVASDSNDAWGFYSGTYNVPVGQAVIRCSFVSISSAAAGSSSFGNFLDGVQFTYVSTTANFSADTVCAGTPTTFIDLSTITNGAITDWEWDFDNDGVVDDIRQNPTHTFPTAGVHPVSLSLPGICSKDITIDVVVDASPIANFSADTVCSGLATNFTDLSTPSGSILQWQWDFQDDGIIDDVGQNPNHIYPSTGTYPVRLAVSGACGNDTLINVEVKSLPTANFSADTVCVGLATTFTDLSTPGVSVTQWEWDFENDGIGDNTSQNPMHIFATSGTFPVHLTIPGSCGHDTLINVLVIDQFETNFSADTVCVGLATTFTDLSAPSSLITQWEWDFDNDGIVDNGTQNPTFMFSTVGTYPVHLTIPGSCGHDTLIDVLVNPYPVVDFDAKGEGCDSVCVTMNNNSMISTGTLTYRWDFGDGFLSNLEEPSHCFQNASNSSIEEYDVTLTATSNFGCVASKTNEQEVTVFPVPLAQFLADPEVAEIIQPEISFTDLSVGATVWNWSFGDGTFSIDANPIHEYPDTGYYDVILGIENSYGCTDTTNKKIQIRPDYAVFIPNAFTPDGDGDNEFFRLDGYGIKKIELLIFDRWGSELFSDQGTEFNQIAWDGTYKGKIVKTDVYVYKVKITDVFNKKHDYVGRLSVFK